jgi:hypothetical protein
MADTMREHIPLCLASDGTWSARLPAGTVVLGLGWGAFGTEVVVDVPPPEIDLSPFFDSKPSDDAL